MMMNKRNNTNEKISAMATSSWPCDPHSRRHARGKPGHGILEWTVALLIVSMFAIPTVASDSQPTLDELLDLPTEEKQQSADESDITRDIEKALSYEDAADAFKQAVNEMGDVAERLGQRQDPGINTQRMQEDILKKLDQIIAAAKQQQQQQSSSSSSSSSQQQQSRQQDSGSQQQAQQQPGQQQQQGKQQGQQQRQPGQSDQNTGEFSPGSVGDEVAPSRPMEELRREWGNLPPRLRDELSEGLREKFSPMYRRLTERYYRGLAETTEE